MSERTSYMPPEIAVADAMHFVRRFSEERGNRLLNSPYLRSVSLEKKLEIVSSGACRSGSIIALNYLQKTHGDEFDKLMLVKGNIPANSEDQHQWAVYFLAHSKSDGKWFSGSPANHRANQKESRFSTVIASNDLDEIFKEIAEIEGGIWPTSSDVLASIDESYQKPEFSRNNLGGLEANIFTFEQDPGTELLPDGSTLVYPPFEMAQYSLHPSYQLNLAA